MLAAEVKGSKSNLVSASEQRGKDLSMKGSVELAAVQPAKLEAPAVLEIMQASELSVSPSHVVFIDCLLTLAC